MRAFPQPTIVAMLIFAGVLYAVGAHAQQSQPSALPLDIRPAGTKSQAGKAPASKPVRAASKLAPRGKQATARKRASAPPPKPTTAATGETNSAAKIPTPQTQNVATIESKPDVAIANSETAPPDRVGAATPSVAQAYCAAIVDDVAEARAGWQMQRIAELDEKLRARIGEFESKSREMQRLVDKQEDARKKMDESVVAIFSRMRSESAASQLSLMEDAMAALVLSKLNPRIASSILNEIVPAKAARIADAMSGVSTLARN